MKLKEIIFGTLIFLAIAACGHKDENKSDVPRKAGDFTITKEEYRDISSAEMKAKMDSVKLRKIPK